MKSTLLASVLITLSISFLFGQKVFISKVELAGSKIIVYYDLEDSNPNAEYLLNLYTSKDNFIAPVTKVSGAVGAGVKPGINRKIEWNAMEELGPYKGKLALEVKGRVYVPVVRLESLTKKKYKRGKSYQLVWRPGEQGGQVHIELYKGNERIIGERNLANNGSYTWHVPASTKTGKNYRLKFTNSRSADEVVYTSTFHIAPKVPLLVKVVLPILAVGGVVAVLGSGGEGGGGTTSSGQIELPPLPGN